MADERQVLIDVGQRLLAIQAGTLKPESKAQELNRADQVEAATASYQKRFDTLIVRLGKLSKESER